MSIQIKIEKSELSKKKLFLATPMYGGACSGMYTRSLVDLGVILAQWGVHLKLFFLFNESLITRARNYCADEFMRSDCTHLLFIDSDIGFDPRDVLAMLALSTDESEYDVLCAPYPKKCISWEKIKKAVDKGFADDNPNNLENFVGDFVFNPLPGHSSIQIDRPSEVLESGTGFMLIQRRAFEKVNANRPDLMYRPDHVRTAAFDGSREIMAYFMDPIDRWSRENHYRKALEGIRDAVDDDERLSAREYAREALEHTEPESKRLLSEDYFFCQEVRKAGGKVWLCPWMRLQHVGTYTFGGSLEALAAAGATATASHEELAKSKR